MKVRPFKADEDSYQARGLRNDFWAVQTMVDPPERGKRVGHAPAPN